MKNSNLNKPTVAKALVFAEKNLIGKSIYHHDIGKKIFFTKKGIEKAINGKGKVTRTRLQLVFLAKNLLKKSRLFKIEKDRKKRIQIDLFYIMRTKTILDEITFEVIIKLKEGENGVIYYDHTGVKLKKQPNVSAD